MQPCDCCCLSESLTSRCGRQPGQCARITATHGEALTSPVLKHKRHLGQPPVLLAFCTHWPLVAGCRLLHLHCDPGTLWAGLPRCGCQWPASGQLSCLCLCGSWGVCGGTRLLVCPASDGALPCRGHNWNALFLGANALADVMAERYSTSKQELLGTVSTGGGGGGVRVGTAAGPLGRAFLGILWLVFRPGLTRDDICADSWSVPGENAGPVVRVRAVSGLCRMAAARVNTQRFQGRGPVCCVPSSFVCRLCTRGSFFECWKGCRGLVMVRRERKIRGGKVHGEDKKQ